MTGEQLAKSMAFKNAFNSEHGKKVLEDLDRYGFYKKPDACFDPDSERVTSFNLGKLAIIRYIHQEIERKSTETESKAIHKEI